jgi:molybdenum cofactor cytidylyltransferase
MAMTEVAAVILAAGRSTRFAADKPQSTKLAAQLNGKPLVRHVADAALASDARPVVAVTGHARMDVEAALAGLPLTFVHNPDYASGVAGSLKAGLANVPASCAGAIILLGDMPLVTPAIVNSLIEHFRTPADAVVPLLEERRGNPVLFARSLFPALARLTGDEGARHLLLRPGIRVVEVALEGEGARVDIDTPEALKEWQGRMSGA